jgi:hypothetical protein
VQRSARGSDNGSGWNLRRSCPRCGGGLHPHGWLRCLGAWSRLRDEVDRCSGSARKQRSATCERRLSGNQSRDGQRCDAQPTTDQRGKWLRVRQRFDRRQQNRPETLISGPDVGRPARALDPVERLLAWRREHAEAVVEPPVADRALPHSSTEVRVEAEEPSATGCGTGDGSRNAGLPFVRAAAQTDVRRNRCRADSSRASTLIGSREPRRSLGAGSVAAVSV